MRAGVSDAGLAWLDHRVLPAAAATVLASDRGLLTGDGVFETMVASQTQAARGVTFALSRHLDRLVSSASILGLPAPDIGLVREAVAAVLLPSEPRPQRVRVTWTAGPGPDGPPTLLVTAAPTDPVRGLATVALVPWARNERSPVAGAKTVSYADNAVALRWARDRGADEPLFATSDGRLCEGATSNVFAVIDGVLVTPTLSTGCLPGVTRGLVLQWCGAEERDLPAEDLLRATEVFLTSTSRRVQPVSTCLPTAPGATTTAYSPGEATRRAIETFEREAAAQDDP